MARFDFRSGDIFRADAEALVNAVNCVGAIGRGIALLKAAFPKGFDAYQAACARNEVQPGKMLIFETGAKPRYIINFPTKHHWEDRGRIEDIALGLKALAEEIRARGIRSIAIPALGCGLGGLDWKDVRQLIIRELGGIEDLHVLVFEQMRDNAFKRVAS